MFLQNIEIAKIEEEFQRAILANDRLAQERDSIFEENACMKQSHIESLNLL